MLRIVPHTLGLSIGLDELDLGLVATGKTQVVQGDIVDRKDSNSRPVFGAHIAQRGAVS